jgi:hypothetical protein
MVEERLVEITDQRVRIVQIICASLIAGVVVFAAIAVGLVLSQGPGQGEGPPLVSLLAIGFLLPAVVSWFIVPKLVINPQIERIAAGTWTPMAETTSQAPATDAGRLLAIYQARIITANALLEGTAFFGLVAYVLEGRSFVLAVPFVAVALMMVTFPTRGRIEAWINEQLIRIRDRRSM